MFLFFECTWYVILSLTLILFLRTPWIISLCEKCTRWNSFSYTSCISILPNVIRYIFIVVSCKVTCLMGETDVLFASTQLGERALRKRRVQRNGIKRSNTYTLDPSYFRYKTWRQLIIIITMLGNVLISERQCLISWDLYYDALHDLNDHNNRVNREDKFHTCTTNALP